MKHVSGKSYFNPKLEYDSVCFFKIKLQTFGFVFIDLDNSVVHMCLYVWLLTR